MNVLAFGPERSVIKQNTMKSTFHLFSLHAILLSMMLLAAGACQDDASGLQIPPGTRIEQTADSIYLYARELYLWHDALPDYTTFSPRHYVTHGGTLENFQDELFHLTQYPINSATGQQYETSTVPGQPKYSFIQYNASPAGRTSAASPGNTLHGFGLETAALGTEALYIRQILPGSPAAIAGLHRGQQITAVNGKAVDIQSNEGLEIMRKAWINSTVTLSVQGIEQEITLLQAGYTADPISTYTLLRTPEGPIGYLALNAFPPLASAQASLDNAFAAFAPAGITRVIIDLRYNGGGYLETAEYLLGLLAPSRLQGVVLYTEQYNALLQQHRAPILAHQRLLDAAGNAIPYQGRYATYADVDYSPQANTYTLTKHGALESVTDVTVITTAETASASEFVIHALRPHMRVHQVGTTSYGKPVGFFPVTIDQYMLWMPTFNITNADGDGSYYNGLAPDIPAADDITHDFGDPQEASIAAALTHTSNSRLAADGTHPPPQIINKVHRHTGLIETRATLRKN
jgi:carboxyl-terminal processing protease